MAEHCNNDVLWLDAPAGRWLDGFPLGNGRMGAMALGGVTDERIALNHENLWRGALRGKTTVPVHQHLPEIRALFLAGKWQEAAEKTVALMGDPNYQRVEPFQTAGDLWLRFPAHQQAEEYRRSLDLATGTAEVSYRVHGVRYRRELFISAVHGVLVLRVSADAPGAITGSFELTRIDDQDCTVNRWAQDDRFGFTGSFPEGISFAHEARVVAQGGACHADGAAVQVTGADAVLLVMSTTTGDGTPEQFAQQCASLLDTVPLDYDTLREDHCTEHEAMFRRVALELPADPALEALPLSQRVARLRAGESDHGLLATYFQYGRYLLMASSRRCEQPANLQGLWSEGLTPPWSSDYHLNINLQMNYWIAEVGNLDDCTEPLFNFLQRIMGPGRKAARDFFNCRGLFLPHATDVWAAATMEHSQIGMWTCAAAWLSEHFWWHYEYSLDIDFLRETAYPFMKEAAAFYEDFLVRDAHGWLVTVPSQSPENRFVGGSEPVSLCVAATMDVIFIRELLGNCLRASKVLGCDAELRAVWKRILDELPPFQIGKHGQLQEWLKDFEECEPGHRHISHAVGVYPGEVMTPDRLPECYRAVRVALERRLACGGGHTGWSRAWTAAFWARFMEGDLACEHLQHLVADFSTDSLLDLHPMGDGWVFQIDGNFGGAAAIAELLLQSHGGVIRLLPALPSVWATGRVSGLRARGGFTIDLDWRDRQLVEARIFSEVGTPCRIAWPAEACIATSEDDVLDVRLDAHGYLIIDTEPGQRIVLRTPVGIDEALTG